METLYIDSTVVSTEDLQKLEQLIGHHRSLEYIRLHSQFKIEPKYDFSSMTTEINNHYNLKGVWIDRDTVSTLCGSQIKNYLTYHYSSSNPPQPRLFEG